MNRSGAGSGASTTSSRVRLATTGSASPRTVARYSAVRRGSTSTTCTSSWRASTRQRTSSPHTTIRLRPNGRARSSRPPASRTSRCRPEVAITRPSRVCFMPAGERSSATLGLPVARSTHATTTHPHMPSGDYLVWIDLEMTGLKPDTDSIIEIATVVTDRELNLISDGPVLAIHQPDEVLARMDDWNQRQPASWGRLGGVRGSRTSVAEAQQRTLEFLAALVNGGRP